MPVSGRGTAQQSLASTRAPRAPVSSFRPAIPHLVRTVPWRVLIAACATGLGISFVSSQFLSPHRSAAGVLLISAIAAVPVAGAAAFLPFMPDRNLVATLPAPSWLRHAIRLASALPVIGLTAVLQFWLTRTELPADSPGPQSGQLSWPPRLAEFVAWLVVSTAAAAAVDRTRWRDLGGALAAPLALTVIALLALAPLRSPWVWWAIAVAAALGAAYESRDPWCRLDSTSRAFRAVARLGRGYAAADTRPD